MDKGLKDAKCILLLKQDILKVKTLGEGHGLWIKKRKCKVISEIHLKVETLKQRCGLRIKKCKYKQGPIKPRMGPGPDVHSGPYSKSSQKFKYL